ncbi:MAG TPA: DUF3810 domain-containing protein [Mucilaginibacter sp.]|nr:DUF3810 domain-containing protein [Mucilaginibacter sp.]
MATRGKSHKRSFRKRIIAIAAITLALLLLAWTAGYPHFVERYYTDGFYRAVCFIFHPVFNLFPFSVGDIAYIAAIIYLLYTIVKLLGHLFHRRWTDAGMLLLGVVAGVEAAMLAFYLFWGMNYYRPPASEVLNLRDTDYTVADLRHVTAMLIDSANACRQRVTPADLAQKNKAIYVTAVSAVKQLTDSSGAFKTYHPDIKSSLITPLLNYLGTSGYYNPFTAESQMNYEMPVFLRPFVACHELSHQMGFAPEDEANFVGFIAAIHSKDRLMRYSAYYEGVQEFMFTLRHQDSLARKELRKRILPQVLNDFKTERLYWVSYEGKVERLSSIFYDNFLKVNNQPYGLKTYNRMVLLILAYRKKNRL